MLCVSPPIQVAFAGALVARSWRAPLVLLVQDLPLDAALSVGMLRPGAAHRAGRWLERRAYALAHRIVVISRRFEPSLSQQGVPDGKVVEIPGWADLERVRPRPAEPDVRALLGATGDDLVVLHAGSMGAKQALDSAVRAARLAMDDSVRLALVGDGPERPGLEALAGGAVRLLPLQPDAVFVRMLAADVAEFGDALFARLVFRRVGRMRSVGAIECALTYVVRVAIFLARGDVGVEALLGHIRRRVVGAAGEEHRYRHHQHKTQGT